ncbi:hypothetical protein PPH41_24310, partial [Burkholderia gladioli]|nr:hypothetical protein [Burkholderia gladioli]
MIDVMKRDAPCRLARRVFARVVTACRKPRLVLSLLGRSPRRRSAPLPARLALDQARGQEAVVGRE